MKTDKVLLKLVIKKSLYWTLKNMKWFRSWFSTWNLEQMKHVGRVTSFIIQCL